MFVIDPGGKSKFFPGFGNGPTIKIGKFGDHHTCLNKVKALHPTANAASFGKKDFSCFAVFNATSRNVPNKIKQNNRLKEHQGTIGSKDDPIIIHYTTCIFGGNLIYF